MAAFRAPPGSEDSSALRKKRKREMKQKQIEAQRQKARNYLVMRGGAQLAPVNEAHLSCLEAVEELFLKENIM